jgi:hypothetical protein
MAKTPAGVKTKAPKIGNDRHGDITDNYNQQPQPCPVPNTAGYPQTGAKTEGIKIRGTGAATKGVKARGPMA